MTRFRLSRQAKSDLEGIAVYIGDRNPPAANRELEKLLDKFAVLGKNPLLGELRQDLPGAPHCFVAGSFLILYKPMIDGIEVARVVLAARDLRSLLHEE